MAGSIGSSGSGPSGSSDSSGSSEFRSPVEKLAEEFVNRHRRGEDPSLTEYIEKYPEWSVEIQDLFPTLLLMEEAKVDAGVTDSSYGVTLDGTRIERFGDYRILRKIGEGGMGIVFEAEQISLGRHVALKLLSHHSQLRPQQLARFHQESRAAARLHHTNIVPVFGVGEEHGLHYYVMQFISGLGLDEVLAELKRMHEADRIEYGETVSMRGSSAWLARSLFTGEFAAPVFAVSPAGEDASRATGEAGSGGTTTAVLDLASDTTSVSFPGDRPLSTVLRSNGQYFRSVAQIGLQVAEAVAYAHEQGTLHRDIKPSNLILDNHGRIWVTDFGLAKIAEDRDLTQKGDIVGTLRYMAPERFKGDSGPACDVYGLGLTLYELIALRPAFEARERTQLIRQITEARIARLRQLRPETPNDLERIVMKAIQPEPEYRYQRAQALAIDLRNFLEDRPVSIKRALPSERIWKWCRRNPLVATLTLAIVLLMVAITVGSIYSARRLRLEQAARSRELADKLLTTPATNLPYIIDALRNRSDTGWREFTLPRLRELLANDVARPRLKLRAAVVLTLLGQEQRELLVASVPTASARECGNLAMALREGGGKAVDSLLELSSREADLDAKARIALVLLGLGEPRLAQEMLTVSGDPLPRTTLIGQFPACHPDLSAVSKTLLRHTETDFRSGICAALGTIEPDMLPVDVRSALEATLLELHESAPSGATHSAAAFALQRWQVQLPDLAPSKRPRGERGWFVNSLGMHMIKVPSGFLTVGDSTTSYPYGLAGTPSLPRCVMHTARRSSISVSRRTLSNGHARVTETAKWSGGTPRP